MKKVIRLTETDITNIVKKVIKEQEENNSDLINCLTQNGFQKNTSGTYVNPNFNIHHKGEKIVRVFINQVKDNEVVVKALDGDKLVLPNNRFKWNQNCGMFLDLLKNRIQEKINNKGGLSDIKISG